MGTARDSGIFDPAAREFRAFAARHPLASRLAIALLAADLVYASWRAAFLKASDLRVGYLVPTRGLLFEGKDLLRDFPFNSFPPFFYCVLAPFSLLPDALAALLWNALQIACFFAALALTGALLRSSGDDRPPLLLPALIAAPLLLGNLHLGQSNLLPLALTLWGVLLLRRNRPISAGFPLAAAVAFKLTPALALAYLVATRSRLRLLLGATAGLALFFVLVPTAVFGPVKAGRWLADWTAAVAAPFTLQGTVKTTNLSWRHTNQSLEALAQRTLSDSHRAHRVANLGRLLLAGGLGLLAWRSRRRSGERLPLEVALVLLAALFVSPISWSSHYVVALPAYVAALSAASRAEGGWRVALVAALALAAGLVPLSFWPATEALSPLLLGHLALFGVLLGYCATYPPSTSSAAPVTKDAASEQSQSTAEAISSGLPSRPMG